MIIGVVNMEIKIKYFNESMPKLKQIENGDWIDLYSRRTVEMLKGEFRLIALNVAMELPEGCEALVVPRSSTFKKYGIIQTNSIGVIDNSYNGDSDEWMLPVFATRNTIIESGDRIAQFRLYNNMPTIKFTEVTALGNKDRGGFGSTGI